MIFKKLIPFVLGAMLGGQLHAADVKISALPAASALGGTELFETVQTTSKKATAAQIAAFVLGTDSVNLTAFGRSFIDDASASAARTSLGVVIGTNVQAWDADLDTYASTSNAPTATALAANGTNCDPGDAARGSDTLGNAEGCFTPSGGGAPTDATYITQTANGSLSAEFAMGALATGLVKNTTTTGVPSIAVDGTDYYKPGGTDVAFADGGTGLSAAADDTTLVSSGSAWVASALANCLDTVGQHVNYNATTNAWSCGTSSLSGITGLANPTGTVGLIAANGSATTAMRSDGAPALDVSIAPTWTGIHTFSSAEPRTKWSESDQAADEKLYDFDCQTKVCAFRTRTDADVAGVNILAWTRGTGTAISNISLGDTTNNPTFTLLGTGTFTMGGTVATPTVLVSAANPRIFIDESDQGSDLKKWAVNPVSGVLTFSTVTDALGAGKNFLTVTRGTTTAIASIALGNATDNPTFDWLGTGNATFGGGITTSGIVTGTRVVAAKSLQTPTTGFSITIANNAPNLVLNPAGTLATGTVTTPAAPVNSQTIAVSTTQIITAFTLTANSGQTVLNAPTTMGAGTGFAYIYDTGTTTWYRQR